MKINQLETSIAKIICFGVFVLALLQTGFAQQEVAGVKAGDVSKTDSPAVQNAGAEKVDPTAARNLDAVSKPQQEKIKVIFDDANPGVIYVEANGERVRVDVNKKTVEPAAAPLVTSAAADE